MFKAVSAKPVCSTVTLAHRDGLAWFSLFWGVWSPISSTKQFSFHIAHLCLAHVTQIMHMVIFRRASSSSLHLFSLSVCVWLQKVPRKLEGETQSRGVKMNSLYSQVVPSDHVKQWTKHRAIFLSSLFSNREVKISLLVEGETQMSCWRMMSCMSL